MYFKGFHHFATFNSITQSTMESFPQMCFEGRWLQNRLGADKNESRSVLAVDIQRYERGGYCIVPILHSYHPELINS